MSQPIGSRIPFDARRSCQRHAISQVVATKIARARTSGPRLLARISSTVRATSIWTRRNASRPRLTVTCSAMRRERFTRRAAPAARSGAPVREVPLWRPGSAASGRLSDRGGRAPDHRRAREAHRRGPSPRRGLARAPGGRGARRGRRGRAPTRSRRAAGSRRPGRRWSPSPAPSDGCSRRESTPEQLVEQCRALIERRDRAAHSIAVLLKPDAQGTVMTHSASATVREALLHAGPRRVVCTVSEPHAEGRPFSEDLTAEGLAVELVTDEDATHAVASVSALLVGADSVFRDGSLVNKIGTSRARGGRERGGRPGRSSRARRSSSRRSSRPRRRSPAGCAAGRSPTRTPST